MNQKRSEHMGLFSKKTVRELTAEEEKQIKEEMLEQILTKWIKK